MNDDNKLKILNPEHCLEILSVIFDKKYPIKKVSYASYISMSYFVEYIEYYTPEQIESVLGHKNFNLFASNRFIVDLRDISKKSYLDNEIKNTLSKYEYNFKKIIHKDKIELLLAYDFDKEKTKEIVATILDDACFYLEVLNEINPEYTQKLLSSPGTESVTTHPLIQQNLLQTVVANTIEEKITPLIDLSMKSYKDILLADVNKYIGEVNFNYTINYCLYLFENKHYKVFEVLAPYNSQLNEFDSEVILNGILNTVLLQCIKDKNEKQKTQSINSNIQCSIDKFISPLLYLDSDKVLKKIKQLIELNETEQNILIDLQNHVLNHKLNNKLLEKNTKEKRNKI